LREERALCFRDASLGPLPRAEDSQNARVRNRRLHGPRAARSWVGGRIYVWGKGGAILGRWRGDLREGRGGTMAIDLLKDRGTPLEKQKFTWKDLTQTMYSKLDDDAFTRVRVILMN